MRYLILGAVLILLLAGCEKEKPSDVIPSLSESSEAKEWETWDPAEPGGPYPWEDDEQIKYELDVSIPDGDPPASGGNGEEGMGDTGETGGTWDLPEWGTELPDYDPDNTYLPEMP